MGQVYEHWIHMQHAQMQNKKLSIPETWPSWKPLTSYFGFSLTLWTCQLPALKMMTWRERKGEPPPCPVSIISQTKIEPWWKWPAGRNKMKPVGLTFTHVLHVWIFCFHMFHILLFYTSLVPGESDDDIGSPATEVMNGCESKWGCWELNSGPQQEDF